MASINDIANFVKKTNFDNKLTNSNKKITLNNTRHIEVKKKKEKKNKNKTKKKKKKKKKKNEHKD